MAKDATDQAMLKARKLFEKSGKSLDELGQAMGYEGDVARKAAWQFLNKTADPRLSMLRRFAKAMDVAPEELIATKKPKRGQSEKASREGQSMKARTAEEAEKSHIIESRIQCRYETLTGGHLLKDDRLDRVRELPVRYLERLADELDRAIPQAKPRPGWPSIIVTTVLAEYAHACRDEENEKLNASGCGPAEMTM
ncbi:MAG TPA: helix-turn-helix transcriptional regulator [Thermoanaerobaculia bacterium]|nr:helix-turn-helix transcriptional regulator [Thermoanaerobaculia bacterium]